MSFFRGLSVVAHFRQLSASPSQGFSCLANHEPAILLKFRAAFTSKTYFQNLFHGKHYFLTSTEIERFDVFCNIVALKYAIIYAPGKGIWKHHEYALENVWRVLFWSGGLFFAALVAGEFFVYSQAQPYSWKVSCLQITAIFPPLYVFFLFVFFCSYVSKSHIILRN